MKIGYARVSTQSQELNTQVEQLESNGVDKIYSEKFTGTKTDRPQFQAMLESLNSGDEIVITKLDRLARNTKEALTIIDELMKKDIAITVLNLGKLENTSVGRMIYTILLSVAEMERDMIVSRTAEGKAYAKKHNPQYKEGRPKKFNKEQRELAMEMLNNERYTVKQVSRKLGISEATLYRLKREAKL